MLPKLDVAAIRHYCEQRIPPHALDQVRVEAVVEARTVTIVERRAPWRPDLGLEWTASAQARFRYAATTRAWTLYWGDSNRRWHRYELIGPSNDVRVLLDELDRDPTAVFWG
jgi:hypothetical protein